MLDENEKWILPCNLIKQGEKEIKEVDEGNYTGMGDFGSYYGLLTGKNLSWVKAHAIVEDKGAIYYVKQIASILSGLKMQSKNLAILDVGCGTGAVTNAFRHFFKNSSVTGIEISRHAIAYAQKKYRNCNFIHAAFDEQTIFPQKYDIIHAREFYPFTRTSNIELHLSYLSLFLRHLRDNGIIILSMATTPKCFAKTYSHIDKELIRIGLSPITIKPLVGNRFLRFLPWAFSIKLAPAIYKTFQRKMAYCYITKKAT